MSAQTHAHTPGPWKTGGCGEDGWRLIFGPTTRFFHAFGEAHTTGVAVVSVSDCEAEDLANARLIAAAPDLLGVCQRLATWSANPEHFTPTIASEFIRQAQEAIARATSNQ